VPSNHEFIVGCNLELKTPFNWHEHHYYQKFDVSLASFVEQGVDRFHASKLSVQDFIEQYEKPYKPVVIEGAMDSWGSTEKWTEEVCFMLLH